MQQQSDTQRTDSNRASDPWPWPTTEGRDGRPGRWSGSDGTGDANWSLPPDVAARLEDMGRAVARRPWTAVLVAAVAGAAIGWLVASGGTRDAAGWTDTRRAARRWLGP